MKTFQKANKEMLQIITDNVYPTWLKKYKAKQERVGRCHHWCRLRCIPSHCCLPEHASSIRNLSLRNATLTQPCPVCAPTVQEGEKAPVVTREVITEVKSTGGGCCIIL